MTENKNTCEREECKNQEVCFKCKIASISFGTVPGGYKNSTAK
jgi:hypothetical protein